VESIQHENGSSLGRGNAMKTLLGAKELTVTEMQMHEEQLSLNDQIRRRAYELYEEKGRIDGHELEDWLQAESELKANAAAA
jgi:Protein of unknown function (DUF2934)